MASILKIKIIFYGGYWGISQTGGKRLFCSLVLPSGNAYIARWQWNDWLLTLHLILLALLCFKKKNSLSSKTSGSWFLLYHNHTKVFSSCCQSKPTLLHQTIYQTTLLFFRKLNTFYLLTKVSYLLAHLWNMHQICIHFCQWLYDEAMPRRLFKSGSSDRDHLTSIKLIPS